jgi:hypothetical protein
MGAEQKDKLQFKVNDKDITISTKEKKLKSQNITLFLAEKHPFSFKVGLYLPQRMSYLSSKLSPQAILYLRSLRRSLASQWYSKSWRKVFQ